MTLYMIKHEFFAILIIVYHKQFVSTIKIFEKCGGFWQLSIYQVRKGWWWVDTWKQDHDENVNKNKAGMKMMPYWLSNI